MKLGWVNWYSFDFVCDLFVLFFVVYVYFLMDMSFDQKDDVKGWCAMQDSFLHQAQVLGVGQRAWRYLYGSTAMSVVKSVRPWRFIPKFGVFFLGAYFLWYTCWNWFDKYNVVSFMKLVGYDALEYKKSLLATGIVSWYSCMYALSFWTNYDALDCDLLQGPNGSDKVDQEILTNFVPYEWRMMGAYAHICMIGVTWSTIWGWNLLNDSDYGNYGYGE